MRETPWHREDPVDALEREATREAETRRWAPPETLGGMLAAWAQDAIRPFLAPPVKPDYFADEMDDAAERQAARDRRAVND